MRYLHVLLLSLTTLAWPAHAASASTMSQSVPVDGAQQIEIDVPVSLHVLQGDDEKLTVTADAVDMKHLRIRLEHDVLTIDQDHRDTVNLWLSDKHRIDVAVTLKVLRALRLNTAGTVSLTSVRADRLDLQIAGIGSITATDLLVNELDLSIAGAGEIEASGRAGSLSVQLSGLGQAALAQLESNSARVEISGGGSIKLAAHDALDASISGFGEIRYVGHPLVTRTIAGFGSIERIDS